MNIIVRIFKSLRSRSFKTNCSTWYLAQTQPIENKSIKEKSSIKHETRILEGHQKETLHKWLSDNRSRYPWIYFPDEIISSKINDHWYPSIFDEERLVAWIKLARRNVFIHDFESEVALPAKCAFIYDTFVDPEYRRQGLGLLMIEHLKTHLASCGYQSVACHIEDWNSPSINLFKSTGFKPIGKIRYLRLTFFRCLIIDGAIRPLSSLTGWLEHKIDIASRRVNL